MGFGENMDPEISKSRSIPAEINFEVDPMIYPRDVIYLTAYIFTDKYYVLMSSNKEKTISVTIKNKDNSAQKDDVKEKFFNELLNVMSFKIQSESNKAIRDAILQRALFTIEHNAAPAPSEFRDDVQNISEPWKEEKK